MVIGVVEDCAGILSDHEVTIDIDPRLMATVDPEALSHVLANLLGNAARHSPAGSTIALQATGLPRVVQVAVADHGEGIPPEDLPHRTPMRHRVQAGDQPVVGEHLDQVGPRSNGVGGPPPERPARSSRARKVIDPQDGSS